jgi:hypothetical protein
MLAVGTKMVIVKLLREPTLRWTKDPVTKLKIPKLKGWGLHKDEQMRCSMKCDVKIGMVTIPAYYSSGQPYTRKEFDNNLEEYNEEKYFDLNFRDIWLIEK